MMASHRPTEAQEALIEQLTHRTLSVLEHATEQLPLREFLAQDLPTGFRKMLFYHCRIAIREQLGQEQSRNAPPDFVLPDPLGDQFYKTLIESYIESSLVRVLPILEIVWRAASDYIQYLITPRTMLLRWLGRGEEHLILDEQLEERLSALTDHEYFVHILEAWIERQRAFGIEVVPAESFSALLTSIDTAVMEAATPSTLRSLLTPLFALSDNGAVSSQLLADYFREKGLEETAHQLTSAGDALTIEQTLLVVEHLLSGEEYDEAERSTEEFSEEESAKEEIAEEEFDKKAFLREEPTDDPALEEYLASSSAPTTPAAATSEEKAPEPQQTNKAPEAQDSMYDELRSIGVVIPVTSARPKPSAMGAVTVAPPSVSSESILPIESKPAETAVPQEESGDVTTELPLPKHPTSGPLQLSELISPEAKEKLILKIFNARQENFDRALQLIEQARSWDEATIYLDAIFARNKTDKKSKYAQRFADIVYHYIRAKYRA